MPDQILITICCVGGASKPALYESERFDFVSHSRPERESRCSSQVRLLFKASSTDASDESLLDSPIEREYAFLKCFELADVVEDGTPVTGDRLADAGCIRIKPDQLHRRPWYEVVPFSDLLSRKLVIEKHNEKGIYHVSRFVSN